VINMNNQILKIEKIFLKSNVDLSLSLKLKIAELILSLIKHRKKFGLFIILGWQRKWNKFTDISDKTQDIFARRHINIMKIKERPSARHDISTTINFDGAILIDKKGNVIHSGMIIEGLRPKVIAQKINPGRFKDLSEQFGFKEKVHSRHLAAIASSYVFKNTTIFTVSEETDNFHIFEKGKIIYSNIVVF